MAKAPAYQRYPKDYLSSMRVSSMTLEEEGVYNRLLDHAWLSEGIPDDPAKVARIVGKGCTPELAASAMTMFIKHPTKPNWLVSERQEEVRKEMIEYRESKSKAGRKGMGNRWGKDTEKNDVYRDDSEKDNTVIGLLSEKNNTVIDLLLTNDNSSTSTSTSTSSSTATSLEEGEEEVVKFLLESIGVWSRTPTTTAWGIVTALESINRKIDSVPNYVYTRLRDPPKLDDVSPRRLNELFNAGLICGVEGVRGVSSLKYSTEFVQVDETRVSGPFTSDGIEWGLNKDKAKSWLAVILRKAKGAA